MLAAIEFLKSNPSVTEEIAAKTREAPRSVQKPKSGKAA